MTHRLMSLTTTQERPWMTSMSHESAPDDGHWPSMSIAARGRLFFIHVPKTAGTSMRAYLRNQSPPAAVYPAIDWREAVHCDQPLTNFSLYSGHFRANFALKTPSDTRRLVVLRNPEARLLSALRHLRRDPSFHADHALARGKTLSEILRACPRTEQERGAGSTSARACGDV
jgi:hypothetical protein